VFIDVCRWQQFLNLARRCQAHRSHGPLRLPDWPPPLLATFGDAPPCHSRASPTDPNNLPCMPCSLPRWVESGACRLPRGALLRRILPCSCSLRRFSGGSASPTPLSRPAQASPALRPDKVAPPASVGFIERLRPGGYPTSGARKLSSPTNNCLSGSFPNRGSAHSGRTGKWRIAEPSSRCRSSLDGEKEPHYLRATANGNLPCRR
jgi:hypothetical protein